MEPIIHIDGISKTYKGAETPAVDDITLKIYPNEFFGLLGPNGAGKTTTISMMCGYIRSGKGKITIDGKDISQHLSDIKQIIGIVPQDIALYPSLSARENLTFFGNIFGMKGKVLKNRIDECLEKFGLTANANKKISSYSGGMKRRVNLIAGIIHQPKILFLDEPTVGIDVQSRSIINEILAELNKKETTIIYTSHHLDEAEKMCSTVAVIDYGKIIAQGSPADLVSRYDKCETLEDVFLKLTGRKLRD